MKSTVSFFRLADGVFTGRQFTGRAEFAEIRDGEDFVEGSFDHLSQRVDIETGEVVDYQPPAPDATPLNTYSWDASIKRWVATPTLLSHQIVARIKIDARKTAALSVGMVRGGFRWDVDAAARAALIEYVTAIRESGTVPASIVWTDADDIDRTMTPVQFRSLVREAADFNQAAHARSRVLKSGVMAATTEAGVQTVLADIDTGWPE